MKTVQSNSGHQSVLRWCGPLCLILALGACGSGQQDLQTYINTIKLRPGERPSPLPPVNSPDPHEYSASAKRDPFTGGPGDQIEETEPVVAGTGEGPKPPVGHRREVLEGFELDSLAMVGTFEIEDQMYGLVTDPDGLVHRVQNDNYVGRNYGRIVAIRDDRIDVQELIPNGAGGWMYREVSLALDDS